MLILSQYAWTPILHHTFSNLAERCRNSIKNEEIVRMALLYLYKASPCQPLDLFLTKFEVYGFIHYSLRIVFDFLASRKQRVRFNFFYSSSHDTT